MFRPHRDGQYFNYPMFTVLAPSSGLNGGRLDYSQLSSGSQPTLEAWGNRRTWDIIKCYTPPWPICSGLNWLTPGRYDKNHICTLQTYLNGLLCWSIDNKWMPQDLPGDELASVHVSGNKPLPEKGSMPPYNITRDQSIFPVSFQ